MGRSMSSQSSLFTFKFHEDFLFSGSFRNKSRLLDPFFCSLDLISSSSDDADDEGLHIVNAGLWVGDLQK